MVISGFPETCSSVLRPAKLCSLSGERSWEVEPWVPNSGQGCRSVRSPVSAAFTASEISPWISMRNVGPVIRLIDDNR